MSLPGPAMIAAFLAVVVLRTGIVSGGECINAELCTEPCRAQNSCPNGDADCAEGMWCVPSCLPSVCICVPQSDSWNCTWDCAGECEERPVWTGPPEYLIIDLGTLGGWVSVALGVNDCGQVVGGADTAYGTRHPFLWDAGEMIDLGTLPGITHCEAWDINNNRQVVGLCVDYYGGGERAFLWEDGEMIDLGDLGGGEADADAINEAGQVVGNSRVSRTEVHSFLWEDGVMTDLTAAGMPVGVARDISNAGHVVGGRYLWEGGVVTDLGSLGGESTGGVAVNDLAQVVGGSRRVVPRPGEVAFFHAFLWDAGVMTDLGAVGGFVSSGAVGINDAGQVIVGGRPTDGRGGAYLYDPAKGMRRLDTLLSPGRHWHAVAPRAINEAGQMVGSGEFYGLTRAFLMTPLDADFDDDGDTDLIDFDAFRACMTGPGAPVDIECKVYDIDRNGRIDMVDMRAFQWVFGTP